MASEYGEQFIENYSLFRTGELCFLDMNDGKPGLIYVYEDQIYKFDGETIYPIEDRNEIQVFFDHSPSVYWKYDITKHVDGILATMLEGKDWTIDDEVYRYRDGKFYRVIRGYVFTSWMAEEELSKSKVVTRILKDICTSPNTGYDQAASGSEEIEPSDEGSEETVMESSAIILKKKDFPPLEDGEIRKRK